MDEDEDAERRRLTWRCRRGMKELDLLLLDYLQQHWPQAQSAERSTFTALLELPDPVLAAYLLGNEPCPESTLEPLLRLLRGQAARRAGGSPAADAPEGTDER